MADNQKPTLVKMGDTVFREDMSRTYGVIEVTVTNAEAYPMVMPSGYPFVNGVPVYAATINTTNQMLIYGVTIPVGGTAKCLLLTKAFGGVIDTTRLPTADYFIPAGTLSQSTLATRYQIASGMNARCKVEGLQSVQVN